MTRHNPKSVIKLEEDSGEQIVTVEEQIENLKELGLIDESESPEDLEDLKESMEDFKYMYKKTPKRKRFLMCLMTSLLQSPRKSGKNVSGPGRETERASQTGNKPGQFGRRCRQNYAAERERQFWRCPAKLSRLTDRGQEIAAKLQLFVICIKTKERKLEDELLRMGFRFGNRPDLS